MKPTIGRIVHYRSKTGNYIMPAIIVATKDTLWPEGVERGDVPDLDDENHVHLECFTPGKNEHYQEFNVPYIAENDGAASAGSWFWPERV